MTREEYREALKRWLDQQGPSGLEWDFAPVDNLMRWIEEHGIPQAGQSSAAG